MIDKDYKIILPLTLDGLSKYADLYDVTMCNDDNARILVVSGTDFENMNLDMFCLDLYKKYGFLLGDGDYYFLDCNDCKLLKEHMITNADNVRTQLSSCLYETLLNFCDEAIKLNTGIGFDF